MNEEGKKEEENKPKGKNRFWNQTISPVIHSATLNEACYVPSTMGYRKELFSIHSLMYVSTHFIKMIELLPGPRPCGYGTAWASWAMPSVGGRQVNQQLKYPVYVVKAGKGSFGQCTGGAADPDQSTGRQVRGIPREAEVRLRGWTNV